MLQGGDNMNKELLSILDEIKNNKIIEIQDIPKLDLYMDQVITLFDNILDQGEKSDKNKHLTKTMINNYAKDKLLPPIHNKKYSMNHIILLILIYNLKQGIPINSIKNVLSTLIENNDEKELTDLYSKYLEKSKGNLEKFLENEKSQIENLKDENEELILHILSLINLSNLYRNLAEEIVEKYFE